MSENEKTIGRRTLLRGGALGLLAAPALVGKGIAQGAVNWRVQSHWPKASASFTGSLTVLAEEVEKRTDGAFKMTLLGAGEFAKGPDVYNIVRKGVVPMGTISPSYIQDNAEAAAFLFGIPGALRESWEMQHVVKNLGVEDLVNEDLMAEGVQILTDKVLPVEITLTKNIESAADFKGLKIRSSGTIMDFLTLAGAAPQYVPGSELYQAISSGVVDGAHWGAAQGAQSMSLWEVCKYHIKPPIAQTTDAYVVNMDALNDLPDDLRTAFLDAADIRFYRRSVEYIHAEAVATTEGQRDQGVQLITLPDDVNELLAQASAKVMETEAARGERAAKAADIYLGLMKDVGYA